MSTLITDALIDSGEITRGTTAAAVRKLETELAAMTKELHAWSSITVAEMVAYEDNLKAERGKVAAKTTECAELAAGIMEGIDLMKDMSSELAAEREKVAKLRESLSESISEHRSVARILDERTKEGEQVSAWMEITGNLITRISEALESTK